MAQETTLSNRPRSDQHPGEETVQVNDRYLGGGPPPDEDQDPILIEQHATGG